MRRPSDCRSCGSSKTRHNQRDGWCWDGGTFEDATTYQRLGWFRLVYLGMLNLWYRLRPVPYDLEGFDP